MIQTLTGDNDFELGRRLRQTIGEFTAEYGDMAVEKIDGEEAGYDKIRESLESLPFLASRKLVVLLSPGSDKEFGENYERLLQNVPESTQVVIVERKLDKRKSYYKFLKKQTDFSEINTLEGQGLVSWLTEAAKQQQASISSADARYLIDRVGADQTLLHNELNKLINNNPDINRADIDRLCEPAPASTIFDLLDAAFSGNRQRALNIYREQRQLKTEPQQIIAMLAWQLHLMAVVAAGKDKPEAVLAKEAKASPFVISKTRGLVRKLSIKTIKNYISELLEIDHKSKTSPINTDDALQAYLMSIS